MSDYSKYERKFDWNLADLEHNKITIGEYEKQFRAIVDEIRADAIDEYNNKINYLKECYVDACNMCTKMECDICAISNFIDDLEHLKEQKE